MTEHGPAEPGRAHTASSGPHRSHEEFTTAEQLLRDNDDRIATELPSLPPVHQVGALGKSSDANWTLRPRLVRSQTQAELDEDEAHRRAGFSIRRYEFVRVERKWHDPLFSWWSRHVSVKVDVAKRRDHLALERTFLGYLRTSVSLAMVGVVIAQLLRLQHSPTASTTFGYMVAGGPLAECFIAASIVVVLVGAIRFWRQQYAMVRGKVWAGGWEVYVVMLLSIALCVGLFAIALGVLVEHEVNNS